MLRPLTSTHPVRLCTEAKIFKEKRVGVGLGKQTPHKVVNSRATAAAQAGKGAGPWARAPKTSKDLCPSGLRVQNKSFGL